MNHENHWITQGVPEHEDAPIESEQARKERIADECEKMLQEADILDLFLEAPIKELQRREIQKAVAKTLEIGLVDDYVRRAFKRDFRVDCANFAIWIDLCIRGILPSYMLSMTAMEIGHAIEAAVDDEILRIVEGRE